MRHGSEVMPNVLGLKFMNVSIIGTGNVGRALGTGWAKGGHKIWFGSRHPEKPANLELVSHENIQVTDSATAVASAEVVVLAVPWGSVKSALEEAGDLTGKILVDCTNPLGNGLSFDTSHGHESGAAFIAHCAPGARVVKAFNTTGAANMENPVINGIPLAMFVCGDDVEAKKIVVDLATELGFDAIDNGGLSQAHHLESMALVWITQAYKQDWGADFGMAVLKRNT